MKKWWPLLAAVLGIYALALLATAPATLADGGLQRASGGRLRLAEARGTLWSGSGRVDIRDAAGGAGLSEHLAWRLRRRICLVRGSAMTSSSVAGRGPSR